MSAKKQPAAEPVEEATIDGSLVNKHNRVSPADAASVEPSVPGRSVSGEAREQRGSK